jgi:hypothetical protein
VIWCNTLVLLSLVWLIAFEPPLHFHRK